MASDTEAVLDPSDPYRRPDQTFPTLDEDQVARVRKFGAVESLPAGQMLFERGAL